MTRSALGAVGVCLGVALFVGSTAALPSTASALEVPPPVVDDLGRAAEHFHPPRLDLPHVEVPAKVVTFGATDATVIADLEAAQAGEDAAVSEESENLSSDGDEQDAIKKCAGEGLLAILEEGGKGLTYEEAAEKGLAPCFDKLVPGGEQLRALVEYFRKQEAEQSSKAYTDAGENPVVLGNWLRTTASSVHPSEQPPEEPSTTTTPGPKTSGGLSSGAIAAIVAAVAVALFVGYRATQRKDRP